MDRPKIHKKIVELYEKKQEHLNMMGRYYKSLAESGSEITFMTGSCEECDSYQKQIEELEKLLK